MTVARTDARPRVAVAAALLILGAAAPILLVAPSGEFVEWLTLVLAAGAVASGLSASSWQANIDISAAFVCFMLAVAFVGPLGVFVIAILTEVATWAYARDRLVALPVNLAAIATPALLAAVAFKSLAGSEDGSAHDIAMLGVVACGFLAMNFFLLRSLFVVLDGGRMREALRPPRELLPSLVLTVALTLAIAGVYARYGIAATVFVVLIIVAFTYMSRLVVIARERTGQYASLSWGVLSALVRSLDRRDGRTARHSAAVAAFARDIAIESGMDRRAAELAHTAGLLHDIGRFALPDRVMERHGTLTEADWEAIRLHPELGADLLQDLGVYGPVAEIVRAHHERIDGRGYPDRLRGDEIPEIARIVAVAEVYDTLTAEDTYRDRMTSFQAMTELRRVAGRQLDERFVEALATLLTGRGLEYRHADLADFDRELAMHSRIADAVSHDSSASGASGGTLAASRCTDAMGGRLDDLDLSLALSRREQDARLSAGGRRLAQLRLHLAGLTSDRMLGPPLCVIFEGWDAAGKGGAIKRLVLPLDPRHVRVASFGAPTPDEKRHHFMHRFVPALPGWGGMAVLDRSWYGRVLVERVEGLATEAQWRRAYGEILGGFERSLFDEGTILVKFWLHISPEEQLLRFNQRASDPLKAWKLTGEDWRNREQRHAYEEAIEEMLERTDTPAGRWYLVEAESKRFARVKVMETTISAIEQGLRERGHEPPPPLGSPSDRP